MNDQESIAGTPKVEDRVSLLEGEINELRATLAKLARKHSWPVYLTVDETAELLQISPRTLHDWVSQEKIPFHKAGSQTRFLLSEIVEWTAGRCK